jgi:hypothetical protein
VLGYVSLVVTIGIIIYNVYEAKNPTHVLSNTHKGYVSPKGRMASILQHFFMLEIDLKYPYLNANSEDIYSPLD